MASSRPSPTKMSRGKVTTKESPGGDPRRPARAHRSDTPEAKAQRKRMPKTHPTRTTGARKD